MPSSAPAHSNFSWGWVGYILSWSSHPPSHPATRPHIRVWFCISTPMISKWKLLVYMNRYPKCFWTWSQPHELPSRAKRTQKAQIKVNFNKQDKDTWLNQSCSFIYEYRNKKNLLKPYHKNKSLKNIRKAENDKKYTWLEQWQTLWAWTWDFGWRICFLCAPVLLLLDLLLCCYFTFWTVLLCLWSKLLILWFWCSI